MTIRTLEIQYIGNTKERKVLYIQRLDDGADLVMIYHGEVGKGKLRSYGVQSSEQVKKLREVGSKHSNQSKYLGMDVYEFS